MYGFFNDPASWIIADLIFFHDFLICTLLIIIITVSTIILGSVIKNFSESELLVNQSLEAAWTLLPAIILIQLAVPSLSLLYLLEEQALREYSIKVTGHQWFWTYLSRAQNWDWEESDRYLYSASLAELHHKSSIYRLLDVDSRLILPYILHTRILISASDVLHSWTVPILGVKADCVPGRLNQLNILPNRVGTFFGQCREICGANHSYMPIVSEVKPLF